MATYGDLDQEQKVCSLQNAFRQLAPGGPPGQAFHSLHRFLNLLGPVLRSRNYLFSAPALTIISAPATAIYWHLKLF